MIATVLFMVAFLIAVLATITPEKAPKLTTIAVLIVTIGLLIGRFIP